MSLFKKWFCNHKYKIYATRKYRYLLRSGYTYTKDIFMCETCGKIKQIEY